LVISVSWPVREPLAFDPSGNQRRTFSIVHFPGVEFEIPLREVAGQVRLADGVMRAEHRPLHQAEMAFRGVDVSKAAEPGVFIGGVVDGRVPGELPTGPYETSSSVNRCDLLSTTFVTASRSVPALTLAMCIE
jgi:hypothetical protein